MAVMDENNKLLGHRVLPVMGLRPGTHTISQSECRAKKKFNLSVKIIKLCIVLE